MAFNDVRWLVLSSADYPDILAGDAPTGLLSKLEQAKLATLHVDKRRKDWLLGRLTAKRLLQTVLQEDDGVTLSLDRIEIDNDPDGAPFASIWPTGSRLRRLPWSLSISHSNGVACCAVHPTATVGVDLECVESREWNFVRSYFSPAEIELVERSNATERALLVTSIWSGKEAVLKVLREGLRLDTRTITCRFDVTQASTDAWAPFEIMLDAELLDPSPYWSGWWRRWQTELPFVLTLAVRPAQI